MSVTANNQIRLDSAVNYYKLGSTALNAKNYERAAGYFMRAGDAFESVPGYEKFLAEAQFAEAQSRKLAGQSQAAGKLYESAVDLFEEYDPLNAYLKAALDNLRRVSPELRGKVNQSQVRLNAMVNQARIVAVDRNVVLKGHARDDGMLLAARQTPYFDNEFMRKIIYKAFIKMTCLETAELGSNSITAETKWLPLLARGKAVAVTASSDFFAPSISVKLNGRYYNIPIELPDLAGSRRTVFLLTDGANIIAIDPAREDMWWLKARFSGQNADFIWKKLNHHRDKAA